MGRIIKNSHVEYEKEEISPRRRSQQIKLYANEEEIMPDELPYQSAQRSPLKFIKGAKHSSMIERLQDKDKDFHHFVESSKKKKKTIGKEKGGWSVRHFSTFPPFPHGHRGVDSEYDQRSVGHLGCLLAGTTQCSRIPSRLSWTPGRALPGHLSSASAAVTPFVPTL